MNSAINTMKEAQIQAEAKVGSDSMSKQNFLHENRLCILEARSRKLAQTFHVYHLGTADIWQQIVTTISIKLTLLIQHY